MTKLFDRSQMQYFALKDRYSKVVIENDYIDENTYETHVSNEMEKKIASIAEELKRAREKGTSRMCVFGAHTIKNGLGRLLGKFVEEGWFTHLATNGAGIIHDWEFSFLGKSSEDVCKNVQRGAFGTWEETGRYINLAIAIGAFNGLGYGEAVGKLIETDRLEIPSKEELEDIICNKNENPSRRAAAADLLEEYDRVGLEPGIIEIKHKFKDYSIQRKCYQHHIPFTDHPMFGHDIIYTHKANLGAAIGRSAEIDFLKFVNSVSNLEGGVYLSIGSAVMSPMIFEKSLSMSRNVLLQEGKDIRNCSIHVMDLQEQTWDWSKGEPPMDNPAYYLRFMKTFSRMGCPVDYTSMDNRDFLVTLYRELHKND